MKIKWVKLHMKLYLIISCSGGVLWIFHNRQHLRTLAPKQWFIPKPDRDEVSAIWLLKNHSGIVIHWFSHLTSHQTPHIMPHWATLGRSMSFHGAGSACRQSVTGTFCRGNWASTQGMVSVALETTRSSGCFMKPNGPLMVHYWLRWLVKCYSLW